MKATITLYKKKRKRPNEERISLRALTSDAEVREAPYVVGTSVAASSDSAVDHLEGQAGLASARAAFPVVLQTDLDTVLQASSWEPSWWTPAVHQTSERNPSLHSQGSDLAHPCLQASPGLVPSSSEVEIPFAAAEVHCHRFEDAAASVGTSVDTSELDRLSPGP